MRVRPEDGSPTGGPGAGFINRYFHSHDLLKVKRVGRFKMKIFTVSLQLTSQTTVSNSSKNC